MLAQSLQTVKRALPLGLLLGCTHPEPAVPPTLPGTTLGITRRAMLAETQPVNGIREALDGGHLPAPVWPLHLDEVPTSEEALPPASLPDLSALGPPMTHMDIDLDRGQALQDYVDENISSRNWNTYGLAAIPADILYGDDDNGLCEPGALTRTFDVDGEEWEASYSMAVLGNFLGDIEPVTTRIRSACSDALLASGGDISAALADDCDEFDEHTFFPEGSSCRTCLETQAGNYDECAGQGDCEDRAVEESYFVESGEKVWYDTALGYLWACAPDLPLPTYVFGIFNDDGTVPRPFDHANWTWFCTPSWDEESGAPSYDCYSGVGGPQRGHTVGAGLLGRVNYVRPVGSEDTPQEGRLFYASRASVSGVVSIDYFWDTVPGAGQISLPEAPRDRGDIPSPDLADEPEGSDTTSAWGLNPYALRPDGSDPDNLDDTFARDWIATIVLKTATTRNGVPIHTYNWNRCADDAWEGPDEDGSYRCPTLNPRSTGWMDDGGAQYTININAQGADWNGPSFQQIYYMPLATIGATGLPDADVPDGNTLEIAGSPGLAMPDWDDCAWPDQFTPDWIPMEQTPNSDLPGYLWTQTYRFGKDADLDLRVVLNTDQARGYCPPDGRSGEDD